MLDVENHQYTNDEFNYIANFVSFILASNFFNIDFSSKVNISQTNDVQQIIKQYRNVSICSDTDIDVKGITITPSTPTGKQHVYIQTKDIAIPTVIEVLIHELTHVYDNILFANEYTGGDTSIIAKHQLEDTWSNYSEFHAYAFATIYMPFIADMYYSTNNKAIAIETILTHLFEVIECLKNQTDLVWTPYKIFQLFGELFVIDTYCKYEIEQSCIYTYLPQIFSSKETLGVLYDIYKVCVQLLSENNINESLKELNRLMDIIDL